MARIPVGPAAKPRAKPAPKGSAAAAMKLGKNDKVRTSLARDTARAGQAASMRGATKSRGVVQSPSRYSTSSAWLTSKSTKKK